MPCTEWKELLVARLYDDLEDEENARLSRHLTLCVECTRELDDLAGTRETLRTSAPSVPATPRVVLLTPPPSRLSFLAIAASLAGMGLLSGFAAAWSWQARENVARIASTERVEPAPAIRAVSREEMENWLDARLARLHAESIRSSPAQGRGPLDRPLTKPEVEALLTRMERRIDRGRVADIDYLLREMAAAEARTGLQLGETQNALRYLAQASNPRISER